MYSWKRNRLFQSRERNAHKARSDRIACQQVKLGFPTSRGSCSKYAIRSLRALRVTLPALKKLG